MDSYLFYAQQWLAAAKLKLILLSSILHKICTWQLYSFVLQTNLLHVVLVLLWAGFIHLDTITLYYFSSILSILYMFSASSNSYTHVHKLEPGLPRLIGSLANWLEAHQALWSKINSFKRWLQLRANVQGLSVQCSYI